MSALQVKLFHGWFIPPEGLARPWCFGIRWLHPLAAQLLLLLLLQRLTIRITLQEQIEKWKMMWKIFQIFLKYILIRFKSLRKSFGIGQVSSTLGGLSKQWCSKLGLALGQRWHLPIETVLRPSKGIVVVSTFFFCMKSQQKIRKHILSIDIPMSQSSEDS